MARVDAAEHRRQQPFLGEREGVAVDGVVEGEQRGDDAADDQDVHEVGGPGADVGGDGGEEEPARVGGGGLDDLVGAVRLDDGPDDEGVEEAEEGDGDEGGARDGVVGVAGLAAVDGGGLEAGEGGEGAGEDGGHAGDGDVGRGEGVEGEAARAAVEEDAPGEQQQDAGLGDEEHAEHLGAEVDGAVAEVPDEDEPGERDRQPGDLHPEQGERGVLARAAEQPVDADLHAVVPEHRQQRRAHPGGAAEAAGDVGVEAAAVADVAAHRGEADGEDGEGDAGEQVAGGGADAAEHDGDGGDAGHDGERGGRRDHEEGDVGGGEGAGAQSGGGGLRGLGWYGHAEAEPF